MDEDVKQFLKVVAKIVRRRGKKVQSNNSSGIDNRK